VFERIKKAYGDDFRGDFAFDEVARPDANEQRPTTVTSLHAVGHTPGHTVFLIESEGETLRGVGDLLHAAALQFPVPEACARFDMDQTEAVKSRRCILDKATEENIPIAEMHFPYPGIGFVKKNANGGYDFTPIKEPPYLCFVCLFMAIQPLTFFIAGIMQIRSTTTT
jgi:glyoxylase-like metal-dependent hydrolase (beta-lactamase superfamily II)